MDIKLWTHSIMDLLAPRECPICRRSMNRSETGMCLYCKTLLPYYDNRYMTEISPILDVNIKQVVSYMRYNRDMPSHRLITEMKYNHRPIIGQEMGRLMALRLASTGIFNDVDVIIPVPLHWRRFLHRGYNQSMQLALGVSRITGIPINNRCLVRQVYNKTQTNKHSEERRKNVQNIFALRHPERLQGHRILLIDDVLTTGSTLLECCRAIQKVFPQAEFKLITLATARTGIL